MRWKATRELDVLLYSCRGNMFSYGETLHGDVRNRLAGGARKFVIDLGDVPHMSSLGLGTLIALRTSADRRRARVVICRANNRLVQLFDHVRLSQFIDCYTTPDEAVASFGSNHGTPVVHA